MGPKDKTVMAKKNGALGPLQLCCTLLVVLSILGGVAGHAAGASKFGPFQGRIVDADTKEPLEGVVVLFEWNLIHFFSGSTFYDAQETVTDQKGAFSVPGITPLNPMVWLKAEPLVYIYKSGYGTPHGPAIDGRPWDALVEREGGALKGTYIWKFEEGKPVIMLKKLTLEERKRYGSPSTAGISSEKAKLLFQEINKERRFLGLGEVR